MVQQYGLEWVEKTFGLEPQWTKEPEVQNIMNIIRNHLNMSESAKLDVQFYTQGGFNKLYKIETMDSAYMFRVALPVDPVYKTKSEVATMKFVSKETDIPVPRVLAFDDSSQNALGFEWILMEFMPGEPLRKSWRKLTWESKKELIKQIAHYNAQLFDKRFDKIGNIYEEPQGSNSVVFNIGRMVSLTLLWGNHISRNVPRGPYFTTHDWLATRLQLILTDQEEILRETSDEDEIEEAGEVKELITKLLSLLPTLFPKSEDIKGDESLKTMLFHDDVSSQNILVDHQGKITAILDWECVSAVPLWRACQVPALIEDGFRVEKPRRESYAPDKPDPEDPSELDNEGVNELYWINLMQWEQTQLREIFFEEMARIRPWWIEEHEEGALKADFEMAVHNADNPWIFKVISKWVAAHIKGNGWSLKERLLK